MVNEQARLDLKPHQLQVDGAGNWYIQRAQQAAVLVPPEFHSHLQAVRQGAGLRELAGQARRGAARGSGFLTLSRFLNFLYLQGLLRDHRATELAESLLTDYNWPMATLLEPWYRLELIRLPAVPPLSLVAQDVAFTVTLAAALWSLARLALMPGLSSLGDVAAVHGALDAWVAVYTILGVMALGRSVHGLVQTGVSRICSGDAFALHLDFDFFGPYIAGPPPSQMQGGGMRHPLTTFFGLALFAFPACVVRLFPEGFSGLVSLVTCGLLLLQLSPFRQSALTEALRLFYRYMDQTAGRAGRGEPERRVQSLHTSSCVIWTVALGLWLGFAGRDVAALLHAGGFAHHGIAEMIGAGLLLAILALTVGAFVDDLLNGFGDVTQDRFLVRRLWRRKRRALDNFRDKRVPSAQELESLPLLRQMDAGVRSVLLSANNASVIEVDRGDEVCIQGEGDRALFFVLSGQVAVVKRHRNGRHRLVTHLAPGAVFGEVAFFFGQRRTASVRATQPSRLLAIQHDQRISDLDPSRSEQLQLRIWFLQALFMNPWFRDLPGEALDALVFAGEKAEFKAGTKIITEGEQGDACYFIIQGSARVVQNFREIRRLGPGDAFGEIGALRPDLLRTASVIAESDVLVVRLPAERLWSLLGDHLPLAVEIEKLAIQRLKSDVQRVPIE